jgi:pimeloyl-ACP methyl ester carboxylesterase
VLLHGFGATGFTWRHWTPVLEKSHRVFVTDLKGFGASPKPRDGRYSPHDHADAVCRLLDDHGLDRVTLVGHSLGGGVALLTALRLLDRGELRRVRGLVLVASAALPQAVPRFIRLARVRGLNLVGLGTVPPRHVVRCVLRQIVFDRGVVSRDIVEGYAQPLSQPNARLALLETARQIVPPDVERIVERYPELDVPALLIWGRYDSVVPAWVGEQLADRLPDARLTLLERCGHVPPEEQPAESLAPVSRFLASIVGAR